MVPQRNMTHHIQCERMLPLPLSGKVQSFFSSKQDKDVFKWVNRTVLPVILKDDGTARSVIRPMGGHRVDLIVAGAAVKVCDKSAAGFRRFCDLLTTENDVISEKET